VLAAAWASARESGRRDAVLTVLRLLWVGERLHDLHGLQADLVGAAGQLG
jgi:hypothetical protein